ncbi:sulfate ABC transporter permease subunit CysT [Thermoleophilum album]|uniref:sulfate ABC transporter permease subunit CysT n=1 Tax=Thermoleophilum album TaxID=29539 RepID=UPI001C40AF9B|nr:sulfate ABC transporter permease subunit CysT [Thermoleophilum album]
MSVRAENREDRRDQARAEAARPHHRRARSSHPLVVRFWWSRLARCWHHRRARSSRYRRPRRIAATAGGGPLALGVSVTWLSAVVLLPLAALAGIGARGGVEAFVASVTAPQARAALLLSIAVSAATAAVNAVFGTALAWVLVRQRFRGRGIVDALVDLPFALPTIVAGLTLLAVYGPGSPLGVNIAFTRFAIVAALALVTLPFVVRSVQPVLASLGGEIEEAALTLGASPAQLARRVFLPLLAPAIVSGSALAFARAVGEFGSVVIVSGNVPFKTELAPVYILKRVESGDLPGAAGVACVLLGLSLAVIAMLRFVERRRGVVAA